MEERNHGRKEGKSSFHVSRFTFHVSRNIQHAIRPCTTICLLFVITLMTGTVSGQEISIVAVGDITIGSGLTPIIEKYGVDALFAGTRELLQSADIATATLDTNISDRGEPRYGVEHPFRAVPALSRGIANAGFKVVSLATPHIMDFGAEALEDTITLLDWYQVKTAGARLTPETASEPAWVDIKTARVAFLAYAHGEAFAGDSDDTISHAVYSEMIEAVKRVAQEADLIVVSIYWGKARDTQAVSERQRFFARGLIDAGADVVLCQRLHTLQGLELYKGKPVIYSLADFIYETYDKQYSKVVAPKVTFADRALKSIELIPLWVDNPAAKYQPQVLSGEGAQEALVNYQKLCAELGTQVTIKNDRGWIKPEKLPIAPKELF